MAFTTQELQQQNDIENLDQNNEVSNVIPRSAKTVDLFFKIIFFVPAIPNF